jgi:hypothetical protein
VGALLEGSEGLREYTGFSWTSDFELRA